MCLISMVSPFLCFHFFLSLFLQRPSLDSRTEQNSTVSLAMGKKKSKQAGATGAEGLTYMERRALGHGTRSERLGKDSLSNFYDCRLTLMPAVDPVVTPAGFLFSREAILKNLLEQKKAGKRALAEWEAAKETLAAAREEARRRAAEEEARAFDRAVNSGGGVGGGVGGSVGGGDVSTVGVGSNNNSSNLIVGSSTIASNRERGAAVKAAWGTSAGAVAAADASARAAEELRLKRQAEEKPDTSSRCPAGGGKLRLKDLVPVRFYRLGDKDGDDDAEEEEEGGEGEEAKARRRREADAAAALSAAGGNNYAFDPITRDPLTTATPIVVLLPSGCAMSEASYKTCVKPDGSWKGKKIEGVIKLQGGGTGFAAHDGKAAEAASHFALGAGSGRADVRGQLAAGGSRFGLKFAN